MLEYKKKNDMMISKVFLYKKSLKNMSVGLMKNNRKDLIMLDKIINTYLDIEETNK